MSAIHIASRITRIKTSPSSTAADRANALRRAGRSIVNLVTGEPDFDTPEVIRQAACAAIERGETRYTQNNGTPALRQAIADKFRRENRLHFAPDDIIVTCGAKSAIFNALAATLEPGDKVLIPAPFWVSYPDMVLACDGEPLIVPCQEEHGFKLTAEQLRAAITPDCRWLLLNSPGNPSGASYSEGELRALADVLLDHPTLAIMTDDIYEHIRFDRAAPTHLLAVEPALADRTLVVNGVSKTYAMTGWRIGYAAGPQALINAMGTLQSQSTSNACSVSQAAALAALASGSEFIERSREIYRQRRDRMAAAVNDIPGLSCRLPDGAFYLYVNCAGILGRRTPQGETLTSDNDVVLYLLESEGVAVVAGAAYGISPYFRLSIATDIDTLLEGAKRMARAVAQLR
ncbi:MULTISPECIES: aspartate transaminase [Brenneria]|uniref:Aminotransferase n=1 Tax=Brenneria nigrifluens DSM 30175 = ATCC 13028 TaxID=1121120 RepID=A0A2U1URC0_9GAMM|nr:MULTISPECIES: aspartate transaminase [Brenneria]EHD22319.1 Aspartate transaminase [Brenneria sp. EniD312]PWC24142.1 aspartate transaminase [Brenneria nigrifluens] [Brenneria nigrifluens DSM 30175 = ATCC 13028]QCR05334.1 aspartate transaminase [Brenneria nigrifluens] [Brenneria nigrifluens DSM 30175 = ATCC 13028]